ncbi:hypothetical protein AGRA3207_002399 [Actinomadura graeca]|uniref:Capsular polysaccharide biosynthesis protein n=1 Tax=Actinomadura graeca TaxID=2750812 RepID=A0ABX8QRY5_9ACTN|nr:hypothetical protein [Actinomadura graeca]QXJ21538.1 hypothetical protein AGRA3207_002399 [Actinomadura graeca]
MDLLDWVGTLLRRWWLTVPLLLVALAGSGAIAMVTPWKYEAKATAVLLASPVQAKEAGGNPWLVFDSSLTVTAEVVGREMMDERTAAALHAKGLNATYMVGVAPDSTGPVLAIEVTGTDAAGTKATLDALLATVPERLAKLQAQEAVAPRAQIKMNVISASPKAAMVATDKIRLVVMTLFLGIVVTVAVPLFAEVFSERRRRGRPGADAPKDRPEPRASGPQGPGTHGPGSQRPPGSQAPGSQAPDPSVPATRSSGPHPAGTRSSGPHPAGTRSSGPHPTGPRTREPQASEAPAGGTRALETPKPSTREAAPRPVKRGALPRMSAVGRPDETLPDSAAPVPARKPKARPKATGADTPDTYGLLGSPAPAAPNGGGPHKRPDVSEMSEPDA